MNIIQNFYDKLASQYEKLYFDWQSETSKQALILDKLICDNGFDKNTCILDCACGIGTQCIGLASLGYDMTASDLSAKEIEEAKKRASQNNLQIRFEQADFCNLSQTFCQQFDVVIAMDNALPHMLTATALQTAIQSIVNQIKPDGIFVGSTRDYDLLIKEKPAYSPPYIHKTDDGQIICFQTWDWQGNNYKLVQYIIEDKQDLHVSKFECEYRATKREEITNLFLASGCKKVEWFFPQETGFFQPIVIAKK